MVTAIQPHWHGVASQRLLIQHSAVAFHGAGYGRDLTLSYQSVSPGVIAAGGTFK